MQGPCSSCLAPPVLLFLQPLPYLQSCLSDATEHILPEYTQPTMEPVFKTAELVEQILLQLSMRDLLVQAQRVCRYFHHVIISSPVLQQKLFFQGDNSYGFVNEQQYRCQVNPLLRDAFPSLLGNNENNHVGTELYLKLDWAKSDAKSKSYKRKEASWRRMLVTQPPILLLKGVEDSCCIRRAENDSDKPHEIELPKGLRMATLYDVVREYIIIDYVHVFTIKWPPMASDQKGCETDRVLKNRPPYYDASITITITHVIQDSVDGLGFGNGFKSDAHQPLVADINYKYVNF